MPLTNELLTSEIAASGAFLPIPNTTIALTVGPTATTAPVALPACAATVYRFRNASASASPAHWRLAVSPGTTALVPTAYTAAGTGGTVGDKGMDPANVEIYTLSPTQQAAIATGTLMLSAITPAGGSATIYLTPGTSGL